MGHRVLEFAVDCERVPVGQVFRRWDRSGNIHTKKRDPIELKVYEAVRFKGRAREEALEYWLAKQDGRCYLCGLEKKELVFDHDHVTGLILGLACRSCNVE